MTVDELWKRLSGRGIAEQQVALERLAVERRRLEARVECICAKDVGAEVSREFHQRYPGVEH